MKKLLILPNQLFKKNLIPKDIDIIILWEHPQYFTKYKFNKKKLILHRASMKYYQNYIKSKYKVEYIEFHKKYKLNGEYYMFDPIDKIKIKGSINLLDSPNFLLINEYLDEYKNKTDKFFFHNFYNWSKKKLNIIPKVKSQDKLNRQIFKHNINIPKQPKLSKTDITYINQAKKYVNKHFKKNYGNIDNFFYPITHTTANKWLNAFIKNKFKHFGPYQDFINKENSLMFHSILSSSINIGLLYQMDLLNQYLYYKIK